jgi:ferredoxin--NADP+ reductase
MFEDITQGQVLHPAYPAPEAAAKYVRERQPDYFSYADWLHLNALEITKGQKIGAPRVKFTRVADMLAAREVTAS